MTTASADSNNKTQHVIIRPLRASDAESVCKIWCNGLGQTTQNAIPWFLRSMATAKMNEMRDAALSENGDVGPEGRNLVKMYGEKSDRQMFVACLGKGGSSSSTEEEDGVVGCCAVKKGMDEHKEESESDIASIWRMSVDESHRGNGVATKLMEVCEEFARNDLKCMRMGLWTLNPVAANFYTKRMGYRKEDYAYVEDHWIVKLFIPPVFRYEKEL